MSKRREAHIYTDGSCYNNGRKGARGGIGVYWGDGDSRNVSQPLVGRQTNNRAEIEGARYGIEQARNQGYSQVTVHTDSEFLVKGATEWMPRWKENGWQTYSGNTVKNESDFKALDRSMGDIDVKFVHERGHSGVYGNEQADRLANQGARKH
jgi:ribonuclease HI